MSLSSISSQLPRTAEQAQRMEEHLRTSTDCGSTVTKVIAVFVSVMISAAAFAVGGTLVGLVTVVICTMGLAALFKASFPLDLGIRYMNGQHPPDHNHGPGRGGNPYVPGHVGVGAGHMHGPGRGGNPYVPGHVGVGAGHMHGPGHGGNPPHGHPPFHGQVPVGRGHDHGPTGAGAPPPSGPGGHVPVGRR